MRPSGRRVAATATIAMAAWLTTSEVDRLISGMPDDFNRSRTLAEVVSPGSVGSRSAWETWSAGFGGLRSLLVLHSLVDVVLFASLGLLLLWALRDCAKARVAVLGYLLAELLELGALLAAVAALDRTGAPDVPDVLSWAVALLAFGKWLLLVLAAVLAATSPDIRSWWWRGLVRVWHALYFQRLSLVVLSLVAALTLVSGPNIRDQFPDVQRGWVSDCSAPLGGDCRGAVHALAALAIAVLVTAGLVLLGRQRAERASTASSTPYRQRPEPVLTAWWAVPAVTLLLALGLGPLGLDVVGVGAPALVFIALPLVLLGVSWCVERFSSGDGEEAPWQGASPTRAADVRRAGDALALALPVVLLLALVRAYTSLAAVALVTRPGAAPRFSGAWFAATLLLVLAVPAALLVVSRGPAAIARASGWRARSGGLRRTVGDLLDPGEPDALRTRRAKATPLAAWVLSVVGLVLLLLAPQAVSRWIGVVGVMLLGLGLWALFLGLLQVRLQKRRPLRVFRAFSLRATPLLTLLVSVPLIAGSISTHREFHAVRAIDGTPVQAPLVRVLDDWVVETAPCAVPSASAGVQVQPMLLVAASGGGIRAAYWTTHVMDRLRQQGECGNDATLLSSGVSGGAVGLSLSRDGSGVAAVEEMADPDALGAASAALLVGDTVAGVVGLRVPALLDGHTQWRDRAGVMETRWEQTDPGLSDSFDRIGTGPSGALVLNSAAAGIGCRVLVSQVDLTDSAGVAEDLDSSGDVEQAAAQCTRPTGTLAASIDVHDLYARRGCRPPNLRLVSAAMLAARFPTVTPGGRMPETAGGCEPQPDVQLVDGGYGEASGIGTIADLAPHLAALLRERNRTPGRVIVPIVVFLEEEPRIDLAPQPPGLAPEALVPLAGRRAAAAQTTSGTWLQRASAALEHVCPSGTAGAPCRAAVKDVRDQLPAGAVIVAPRTQPDVDAPLGWTLSGASRTRLRTAMAEQALPGCEPVRGYGCLGKLLPLLGR